MRVLREVPRLAKVDRWSLQGSARPPRARDSSNELLAIILSSFVSPLAPDDHDLIDCFQQIHDNGLFDVRGCVGDYCCRRVQILPFQKEREERGFACSRLPNLAYINPQCLSYPKRPGIASFQALKTDWKKDTVYLYQFPRSKALPNVSPFCLKVETFIKANKIPYEVCPVRMSRSEYGLLPFIELNGEHIADSQIIINRLIEHFNVKSLSSPRDQAVARAVDRMADSHTVLHQFKVIENTDEFMSLILPDMGCPSALVPILTPAASFIMRGKAMKRIAAGIGMMSSENYRYLLKKDYDAFQSLLGEQKFLFGDHITAADCTVFGQLATTLYIPSSSHAKDVLKDQYPALVEYCNRIRDTVFGKDFTSE
ncbi:hypothetical protein Y032_0007g3213 [Ancylostoma ceylanicum]|uniref:GST C-terminal domain-containing protein n=1 Tax=Ancylostoma ceylanicum TaxID=53326 RepID=A0A016VM73_9BILA|nr:hypothetical protein Y032_0007g3213 [Ancylostoma ceylanicum]